MVHQMFRRSWVLYNLHKSDSKRINTSLYMSSRTVYDGTRRKIVIGFDVGTTYSGISYRQVKCFSSMVGFRRMLIQKSSSILDPGHMPGIKGVTKYEISSFISDSLIISSVFLSDFLPKRRFPEPRKFQLSYITTRTDMSKRLERKRRRMGYTKTRWIEVG